MKRNLTVQLDEATINKARVLAARRSTSVSRLVAEEITRLVEEDDRYRRARDTAIRRLDRGFHMGGGELPDRESLHER
jgi:ribosomal protein S3